MGNALKDTLQEEIVNTLEKYVSLLNGQNCTHPDSSEFNGKRFTVKVLPVILLFATEKIVIELITYAQRFVSPHVVLINQDF